MLAVDESADVIPPDTLPPVRRRRFRRLQNLALTLLIVGSMTFTVAAPPAAALAWFAAPIAATAFRLAPSTIKVMTGGATAARAASPLSKLLSGGLGLAAGIGGLFATGGGFSMPWDVQADAVTPDGEMDSSGDRVGQYATHTVTNYEWTTVEWGRNTVTALRVDASFSGSSGWENRYGGIRAEVTCSGGGGAFYKQDLSVSLNRVLSFGGGTPFCVDGNSGDQIVSIELYNGTGGTSGRARVANPEKVMNPDFDPSAVGAGAATITGTATCADPSGGHTATFTNISERADILPDVSCPEGWAPESVGWTSTQADGTVKDLGGVQHDFSDFPQCADLSCVLRVRVDGQDCVVGMDGCYDWLNTTPRDRVECQYGPYAVGLEQCRDLEHIYRTTPGGTPANDPTRTPQPQPQPNPDGTPNPGTPTRIVPSDPEGKPVPDMIPGGEPKPDPYPPGNPDPDPDPPTNPEPDPPGIPPPVPNPPVVGAPPDLDTGAPNCIAGMASWNPVDWIYTPVKCALTWAFVPRNAGSNFTQARDDFIGGGLGSWLGVPPAMFADLPDGGGGGCMGPPLTFPEKMGGETYYPLNACDEPMSKYADMSRALVTLAVGFYGMFAIVNGLSTALVGYRLFDRESQVTANKVT